MRLGGLTRQQPAWRGGGEREATTLRLPGEEESPDSGASFAERRGHPSGPTPAPQPAPLPEERDLDRHHP